MVLLRILTESRLLVGRGRVPLMNLSLFLTNSRMIMAQPLET